MRVYLTILLLWICFSINAQKMPCEISYGNVSANEELIYDIYVKVGFIWIPIGETVFNFTKEGDFYWGELTAKTHDAWSALYKINGQFRTHIEEVNGLTDHYLRWTDENGVTSYDSILFDQRNLTAKEFLGPNPDKHVVYDIKLDHCVQDMVSTFYYIRTPAYQEMQINDQLPLHLFYNKYQYDIDMKYLGTEEKKVKNLGSYQAFKLEAQSIKGKHIDKSTTMKCWISDDELRIPLVFETPMKFGELRISLRESSVGN